MSSRALRKLQKQQELLQRPEDVVEDEESEVEETPKPQALNAFDMLIDADDTDDVEAEAPHSSESNDENVKAATEQNQHGPSASTGPKKNKARRKKKQKNKSGKDKHSEIVTSDKKPANQAGKLDEIDLALKSLTTKSTGSDACTNENLDDGEAEICSLLGIDSRQLNVLNEMKRLFGKVVLEGEGEEPGTQGPGRRRGRGSQQVDLGGALAGRNSQVSRGQGLAGLALRRNVFMTGKEEWPKATSGGLGMEVDAQMNGSITRYRFVHNSFYQDVQGQFESCVESMEPHRLIRMLQYNRKIFY